MSPRCSPSWAWSAGRRLPPMPSGSLKTQIMQYETATIADPPAPGPWLARRRWVGAARAPARQRDPPLQLGAAALGRGDTHRPAEFGGPLGEVGEPAAARGLAQADAVVPDGEQQVVAGLHRDIDPARPRVLGHVRQRFTQCGKQLLGGGPGYPGVELPGHPQPRG